MKQAAEAACICNLGVRQLAAAINSGAKAPHFKVYFISTNFCTPT